MAEMGVDNRESFWGRTWSEKECKPRMDAKGREYRIGGWLDRWINGSFGPADWVCGVSEPRGTW